MESNKERPDFTFPQTNNPSVPLEDELRNERIRVENVNTFDKPQKEKDNTSNILQEGRDSDRYKKKPPINNMFLRRTQTPIERKIDTEIDKDVTDSLNK